MKSRAAFWPAADPAISWKDIEALPIYIAVLLGAAFLGSMILELPPTLQIASLKGAGIVGCLALRHAWISMDRNDDPLPTEAAPPEVANDDAKRSEAA